MRERDIDRDAEERCGRLSTGHPCEDRREMGRLGEMYKGRQSSSAPTPLPPSLFAFPKLSAHTETQRVAVKEHGGGAGTGRTGWEEEWNKGTLCTWGLSVRTRYQRVSKNKIAALSVTIMHPCVDVTLSGPWDKTVWV